MKYVIKTFVFDTEQLLLMQGGAVISFRANEARLLALLLSEPGKLFSKEEILDKVWAGKVVAEQAVFQNIRNLRALFGEESIKTFSKKGYQWQLPLIPFAGDGVTTAPVNPVPLAKSSSAKRIAASLVVGCLLVAAAMVWYSHYRAAPLPKVALLPFIADANIAPAVLNSLRAEVEKPDGFEVVNASSHKLPEDFFWVPQKYFPSISQAVQAPYVMMVKLVPQPDGFAVRYLLKSRMPVWPAGKQSIRRPPPQAWPN